MTIMANEFSFNPALCHRPRRRKLETTPRRDEDHSKDNRQTPPRRFNRQFIHNSRNISNAAKPFATV